MLEQTQWDDLPALLIPAKVSQFEFAGGRLFVGRARDHKFNETHNCRLPSFSLHNLTIRIALLARRVPSKTIVSGFDQGGKRKNAAPNRTHKEPIRQHRPNLDSQSRNEITREQQPRWPDIRRQVPASIEYFRSNRG